MKKNIKNIRTSTKIKNHLLNGGECSPLQNPEEEDELESYDFDYDEIVNYIEKYRELLNKLEENGVPTADLHGGNIGVKDGELIHFDVMDF